MNNYGVTEVFLKNYYISNLKNDDGSYKFKYIINVGSSRSSKTFSLIELALRRSEENKNHKLTIWRDTRESLKSSVWSDFKKVINLSGRNIQTRKDTYPIHLKNGSIIEPHGADATNAHGLTQDTAWLNEPKLITEEAFDQIDQRADQIWIDYNPYIIKWIDKILKSKETFTIHSTYKNNPFCPVASRIKIDSYEPTEQNIKADTANEYMWQVYGLGLKAELPNKIFNNWKTITKNEFLQLDYPSYYGLDWGLQAPTAIVEVKFDGDYTFFVHEILYKSENDIIEGLKSSLGTDWQNTLKRSGKTAISHYLKNLGFEKKHLIICDNNKPEKIAELRRADINAIPAAKGKNSVYYGISFMQKVKIVYTKESINLDNEYHSYEWEVIKDVNLERPVKRNDHILDALRYAIIFMHYKLGIKV